MKHLRSLTVLLLAGLLSACSILPKSEALDVYLLPASTAQPSSSASRPGAWALRVNTPQASRVLDSSRIAVVPQGDRISAYKGARWSDRAPRVLRNRVIDAFLADGRVAVSSDDARLHADLELDTDLRAFQSDYIDGRPTAHILLEARLVDSANQRILASRRFEVRHPAMDTSLAAVVRAFGLAADQLSSQVVEWSWTHGGQLGER